MSVEQEQQVEQVIVSNRREYEQMPTITQRTFAERSFVFLFSCYTTALVVQTLTFIPLVAPVAARIPWIALGLLMFVAGVQASLRQPITKLVLLGVLLGAIIGL